MESNKNITAGLNLSEADKQEVENCPYEIEDIQKFLEHIKVRKQAEKLQFFTASDGSKIDLKTPHSKIDYKIGHLPEPEQKKIKTKKRAFDSLYTKSQNLKRSSFGAYNHKQAGQSNTHERFFSDRKAELLEYFGRMFTVEEVLSIIKKDWGYSDITNKTLAAFFRDNLDEINRLREKHRNSFDHLRLTSKTSRIEELTWMYNKLKSRYEKTSSREDQRELRSTIESIRKEVEGDRLTIQGSVDVNIQQEVNIQIRNELMKTIPLKEIVLGRLSAKLGISPRDLIKDMNTSYYAKLNRLLNTEDADFEDISFPSEQSYDFELIERVNETKELEKGREEAKKLEEKKNYENSDKAKKNDELKKSLLEKLKGNIRKNKEQQEELKNRLL